jgi:hypothetical protein
MAKPIHFDPQQESLKLASLVIFLLAIIPLVLLAKGAIELARAVSANTQITNTK